MAATHFINLSVEETEVLVGQALPRTRAVLTEACWWALIRDFCALYYCCEPELHKVAEEVLDYLDGEHRGGRPGFPGFLCDLVHYEWLQLALLQVPDDDGVPVQADGDLLAGMPVLAPRVWLSSYDYPVQDLGAGYAAIRPLPAPLRLLAHCDAGGIVHCRVLDEFAAGLLDDLERDPLRNGHELLSAAALRADRPLAQVVAEGLALLERLRSLGVLRGVRLGLPSPEFAARSVPRYPHSPRSPR